MNTEDFKPGDRVRIFNKSFIECHSVSEIETVLEPTRDKEEGYVLITADKGHTGSSDTPSLWIHPSYLKLSTDQLSNVLNIKLKKLSPSAVIPTYAKPGDAAVDLTATSKHYEPLTRSIVFEFGLAIEIPEGHFGMIIPRSSIHKKNLMLSNSCGIIDSGYRGPIKAIFKGVDPDYSVDVEYKVGDRVAQLIVLPYPTIKFEEVTELSETERGIGGFGSTNVEEKPENDCI